MILGLGLFLNEKTQNIVEVCPPIVLAPVLLEVITQCPLYPRFLSNEGVKANCDLVAVVRRWGVLATI